MQLNDNLITLACVIPLVHYSFDHNLISVLVLTSCNKIMCFYDSVILLYLAAPGVYNYKMLAYSISITILTILEPMWILAIFRICDTFDFIGLSCYLWNAVCCLQFIVLLH